MALEDWQREILEHGELYRVGGSVRDALMGITAGEDVDYLVRMIPPEELEAILTRHGKVSFVGKSFGVYKFSPETGGGVDLVFPRTERSTGAGHRDFAVETDWRLGVEEDLGRRDFSINAMAEDVRTGRRIDLFAGERDVRDGIIRMVFAGTFSEDPLRILRGIRFATRFGFEIEPTTWDEMRSCPALVTELSAERVQEELSNILTQCDRPGRAFQLLRDVGALAYILPELDRCAGVEQNEYHPDDVFVHSLKSCDAAPRRDDPLVRWAALLHDVGKVDAKETISDDKGERVVFYGHETISAAMTRAVLGRLRYPAAFISSCEKIVAEHMFSYVPEWRDATVRRFIGRVGLDHIENLFELREADCLSRDLTDELENLASLRERIATEVARGRTFNVKDLVLDGDDVMRICGAGPGPAVGRVLDRLLEAVLDEPERNTRDDLIALTREIWDDESGRE